MTGITDRSETVLMTGVAFLISLLGCSAAFAIWGTNYAEPGLTILGSGSELSVLVNEGRSRVLLAAGDDPVQFANAFADVRPLFARRVDILVAAGTGDDLLAPVEARGDQHARDVFAIAPIDSSPAATALAPSALWQGAKRITIGPTVSMTVETLAAAGTGEESPPACWRVIVERGSTRVVIISDGSAAAQFPPNLPAAVLIVSGADPASAWAAAPAAALVANASRVDGPALRADMEASRVQPQWTARVFPGESLRLRFVPGGISVASDAVQTAHLAADS